MKLATAGFCAHGLVAAGQQSDSYAHSQDEFDFQCAFYRVRMSPQRPAISYLALDSLGKSKLNTNTMLPVTETEPRYISSSEGQSLAYRFTPDSNPVWEFQFSEREFTIRSFLAPRNSPQPLVLAFSIDSHATLLGLFNDEGAIRLPALLHIPNQGTLRITSSTPDLSLPYDATHADDRFIRVTFPAATSGQHHEVEYRLEVTSIYPATQNSKIETDPRYDGYRRDFLSMFQINPRRRALANNVASDACAFTVFEYSMMALSAPPLADGLTALDLVRQTLDRYVGAMKGYGMVGYNNSPVIKYDFLDTYPSLLMASAEYVKGSGDLRWASRNYSILKSWTERMREYDSDDDGLLEYPLSGNSGSWPEKMACRPANWWDTIGFGHKDAYSNALAYQAFRGMEFIARRCGHVDDARDYGERAQKIKNLYYSTFYNPATGVLAGWKSADGALHDYYFLFVNGMAVVYGLVTPVQGNQIWDKLLAKMKDVGYNRFDIGLPGNLIPIRKEDYVDSRKRFGGSTHADGSDGFQIYENGGASACYAYYTIRALRVLGRHREANAILYPMLKSFEDGKFQGRVSDGLTYDWMDWQGNPHGYEGLLVDGYLTLLAAVPADHVPIPTNDETNASPTVSRPLHF